MQALNGNAASWFGGVKNVLFVHAHPDDETIATGGTIAGLHAAGQNPHVITLTRGEQGEVREGVTFEGEFADFRSEELRAALYELGDIEHAFLGSVPARAGSLAERYYEDSGMEWGPDGFAIPSSTVGDAALTRASAAEALGDLVSYAATIGAGAIVSYDERGGYGHPDHILAHKLARAAAYGLEIDFWSVETGEEGQEVCEEYDVIEWLPQKIAALDKYRSQLSVQSGIEIEHVGGQLQPISSIEMYRRHAALSAVG